MSVALRCPVCGIDVYGVPDATIRSERGYVNVLLDGGKMFWMVGAVPSRSKFVKNWRKPYEIANFRSVEAAKSAIKKNWDSIHTSHASKRLAKQSRTSW